MYNAYAFTETLVTHWKFDMRYIGTGAILLATIAWLVLNYLPGAVALLPTLAFNNPALLTLFPWLALLTLAVFLVIQLDLLRMTGRWFRPATQPTPTGKAIAEFGLSRRSELFWTLLPMVGTVLLALWLVIVR